MIIASSTHCLPRPSLGSQSSSHSLILTKPHSRSCSVSECVIILDDTLKSPPLLAKIATAASANIFANKEYEMLLRSLNVRRLSFTLLTGENNHFLTHLPSIQEKLVDILRNIASPVVQSEVFLCVRVLLCRLSKHNLTSFWPVLLTELVGCLHSMKVFPWLIWVKYRIFEQVMTNIPPDGSEDLQVVVAACKCLDLLVTLQTEEFQM